MAINAQGNKNSNSWWKELPLKSLVIGYGLPYLFKLPSNIIASTYNDYLCSENSLINNYLCLPLETNSYNSKYILAASLLIGGYAIGKEILQNKNILEKVKKSIKYLKEIISSRKIETVAVATGLYLNFNDDELPSLFSSALLLLVWYIVGQEQGKKIGKQKAIAEFNENGEIAKLNGIIDGLNKNIEIEKQRYGGLNKVFTEAGKDLAYNNTLLKQATLGNSGNINNMPSNRGSNASNTSSDYEEKDYAIRQAIANLPQDQQQVLARFQETNKQVQAQIIQQWRQIHEAQLPQVLAQMAQNIIQESQRQQQQQQQTGQQTQ